MITNAIIRKVDCIGKDKIEIINYGVTALISEIYKTIILIVLSYVLGIFVPTVVALFAFGLYRSFAGGIHSRTQTSCLFSNLAILFSIVYVSSVLPTGNILVYTLIFAVNITAALLYAPSDTEAKPIVSKKQRKMLKFAAIVAVSLYYAISLCLQNYYANIISVASLAESIMVLPIIYKLTKNNYGGVCYGEVFKECGQ